MIKEVIVNTTYLIKSNDDKKEFLKVQEKLIKKNLIGYHVMKIENEP